MRVFHLTASNARRGAECFAVDLADALRARGIDGDIRAVVADPDGGLPIDPLPGGRWSPRAFRELARCAGAADVSVGHGSRSLPALALARAVRASSPFVYRSIGDPEYWSLDRGRRARTAAFLRRASAITTVWRHAADVLVTRYGIEPQRVRVIPRGIDAQRFVPPAPSDRVMARDQLAPGASLVVAVVGSLSAEKRVDRVLAVADRVPEATFLIAGGGTLRDALEASAARRASGRIRFLGPLRDVRPVYAAADVVLLPSDTEGVPGVLIEAAFCGVPAVATDVGGVSDVILSGVTGTVVSRDDIAGMASAVRALASERESVGAAARQHCLLHFELALVVDKWEALLRDVAGGCLR